MILLTLPYPISANRYWASRVIKLKATGKWTAMTYVTPEAVQYRAEVSRLVADAGIKAPLSSRIAMAVRLFPARPQDWQRRARRLGAAWDDDVRCIDLDNANKVLLDSLKGVAFEDDRWVRRLQSERMEPDAYGARVIVAIEQLQLEQPQASLLEEAA